MINKIKKSLFYQQDRADCGISCLMMILKYFNRSESFEELRYLSGTTKDGATLLGLYQCANKIGFVANGCKGNNEELKSSNNPIILRVLIDTYLHYVVYFYYDKKNRKYIIGDPNKGLLKLDENELNDIWKDKFCLTIIPNENFEDIYDIKSYRKDKRKFIFGLISDDKRILFQGLFFSLLISILGLSLSVYSQQLVDNILPSQNSSKVIWSLIILGILLIVRVSLVFIKDTLFNFESKIFNNRITNKFYTELLSLPKLFFDTRKVGDLVARINDTNRIQSLIYLFFSNYINDILTILVSGIFIFYYSSQVGLITIFFVPILVCLIVSKSKSIIKKQREVQLYYALTEANFISTISGISDIKNANRENFFSQHNKDLFDEYQTKKFSLSVTYVKLNAIVNICSIVFLIASISISIYLIKIGNLSIGDLIALLSISGLIISSATNLSLLFIPFSEAKISFERMYNLINIKKKRAGNGNNVIENIERIEVKDISFKYPGSTKYLYEKASLILIKGNIMSLTGNCGVGKSTFIDILLGNFVTDGGSVFYNNISLDTIDKTCIRKKIRVLTQNVHIFNDSILFNITMDNLIDININDVNQRINQLGLSAFFKDFPQNIYTIVGEEGVNLSGGQKQIIGLLRALYDEPQVLILDEPTASLDNKYTELVCHLLDKIKKDIIILLISHDVAKFDTMIDKMYKIENHQIIEIIR